MSETTGLQILMGKGGMVRHPVLSLNTRASFEAEYKSTVSRTCFIFLAICAYISWSAQASQLFLVPNSKAA